LTGGVRRSPAAQLREMELAWPDFHGRKLPDGTLMWMGSLTPKAQQYTVLVFWKPTATLPYVFIRDPKIHPRPGASFEQIPHLIFDSDNPEDSALCLFDPDGREWSPAELIAKTTIYWASEWLFYYELWHVTGDWLGSGVGYENVAQMRLAEARQSREAIVDVH
jgi:hypothetical protein